MVYIVLECFSILRNHKKTRLKYFHLMLDFVRSPTQLNGPKFQFLPLKDHHVLKEAQEQIHPMNKNYLIQITNKDLDKSNPNKNFVNLYKLLNIQQYAKLVSHFLAASRIFVELDDLAHKQSILEDLIRQRQSKD